MNGSKHSANLICFEFRMTYVEFNYIQTNGHTDAIHMLSRELLSLCRLCDACTMAHTWKTFEEKKIQVSVYCLHQIHRFFFPHVFASRGVFPVDIKCWFSTLGSILCLRDDFKSQLTSALSFRSMLSVRVEMTFA